MNIRVTKAELERDNLASIALEDSDGYLSWIGAFHQLHCIVRKTPFFVELPAFDRDKGGKGVR